MEEPARDTSAHCSGDRLRGGASADVQDGEGGASASVAACKSLRASRRSAACARLRELEEEEAAAAGQRESGR